MIRVRTILFAVSIFSCITQQVLAGACSGDSVSFRIMPRVWGHPGDNLRNPFLLPCDTMIVASGDTTTLNPGSMLYFGPMSSEKNIVLVEGTLIANGGDQEPVVFSGTIMESDFGLRPGTGRWGGIHVTRGGALHITKALIVNAEVAVTAQSLDAEISKTYIKGCPSLKGPTKSLSLDFKGTNVDYWSASGSGPKGKPAADPAPPPSPLPAQTAPALNKSVVGWSLLGAAGLATGGGVLWWYLSQSNTTPPSPKPPPSDPLYPDAPGAPSLSGAGR